MLKDMAQVIIITILLMVGTVVAITLLVPDTPVHPIPVVVVDEGNRLVDVIPPARLDVRLSGGTMLNRCHGMGGTLVGDVCQGVDY